MIEILFGLFVLWADSVVSSQKNKKDEDIFIIFDDLAETNSNNEKNDFEEQVIDS